ncbi:hypothetical protein ACXP37_03115, partial [Neisseria meningitidis]
GVSVISDRFPPRQGVWIPACAGMTGFKIAVLSDGFRDYGVVGNGGFQDCGVVGNDGLGISTPAPRL